MRCIFCNQDATGGRRVEHIIPEFEAEIGVSSLPVSCGLMQSIFRSKVEGLRDR